MSRVEEARAELVRSLAAMLNSRGRDDCLRAVVRAVEGLVAELTSGRTAEARTGGASPAGGEERWGVWHLTSDGQGSWMPMTGSEIDVKAYVDTLRHRDPRGGTFEARPLPPPAASQPCPHPFAHLGIDGDGVMCGTCGDARFICDYRMSPRSPPAPACIYVSCAHNRRTCPACASPAGGEKGRA